MQDLRYGENPHQEANWDPDSEVEFVQHQGKELSFTNILDLNSAVRIVLDFDEPAAVVIKHTNPCGVAIAELLNEAYCSARDSDPLSAYGGIVGLNRPIDEATAEAIVSTFLECVIAPGVTKEAADVLASKQNLRVVTANYRGAEVNIQLGWDEQRLPLGTLRQQRDYPKEAYYAWPREGFPKAVTKRQPSEYEWRALRFAWRVCAQVKSNAVVFTTDTKTVGIGGGQPNRVGSTKIAAGILGSLPEDRPKKIVGASDAFFPFRDGLDEAAKAGCTAVVQPGGSTRDSEVIAAADEHNIAMVFTGFRHFRH